MYGKMIFEKVKKNGANLQTGLWGAIKPPMGGAIKWGPYIAD